MATIDQLVVLLVGVGELLVGVTLGGVTTETLEVTGSELEVVSLTDGRRSTSGQIRTLLSIMKHCRGARKIFRQQRRGAR
jgi:hypothetical protein